MVDWLPEETIIPNLPNDIALLCLARVPRQYHPILAAVSKPIRFIVSSPQFFAARSRLGSSEKALYLRIRSDFDSSGEMFAVHRDPGDDDGPVRVAPIPPLPEDRVDGSASAVLGHSIYVIGGWIFGDPWTRVASTRGVWVLDCRTNTWSPGPDMLAPRSRRAFATVLGGKIYVFGGASMSADPFGEVFSPKSGRWDAVPDPPVKFVSRSVTKSVVLGNKIFVGVPPFELRFDAATQTWETGEASEEEMSFLSCKCVVDERLCAYHRLARGIKWRDETGDREWKEVEGAPKWLPQREWNDWKMVTVGRMLVFMAGRGESLSLFSRGSRIEVSKKKRSGTWFTSVKVGENVGGASSRAARWSEEVFFPQKSGAPEGTPRYDPGYPFLEWNCFLVSL